MSFLNHHLNSLKSITLHDLNQLGFDDGRDSKFAFHESKFSELLPLLSEYYRILDINGKRCFRYQSLYFDTPEFSLYHDHHRGKVERHKLCFGKYPDSDVTFFEIKTRNNKYRNQNVKIPTEDIYMEVPTHLKQIIREHTQIEPESLLPSVEVLLDRITLVHLNYSEKVTLDLNIRFKLNGEEKDMKGLVIAEVKQKRYNPESDFFKVQRKLNLYPSSVSKYCLGVACLNPNVKANRFKAGIRRFEEIIA